MATKGFCRHHHRHAGHDRVRQLPRSGGGRFWDWLTRNPSRKSMVQNDREKRRARLDELRQIRKELARSGGFVVDTPDDLRSAMAEAWIERSDGRLSSGDGPGRAVAGGARRQDGDRPLLRMLMQ